MTPLVFSPVTGEMVEVWKLDIRFDMRDLFIQLSITSLILYECTAPKYTPSPIYSITEQLHIDFENGNISKDSYYSYLAYSVFAQNLLPGKYYGKPAQHYATPIIRQIQRTLSTLSPETQDHLNEWIKPLSSKPNNQGKKP